MDEKMKNFDRSIEQVMNEHAVDPPFGMWNRISAQLDAESGTPVSTPAPSAISGRTMAGFFAGALLIAGSFITAYLLNNHNSTPATSSAQPQTPAVTTQLIDKPALTIAVVEAPKQLATPLFKNSAATKPVTAEKKEEVQPVAQNTYTIISEVSVPTQAVGSNAVATADPYYFPPVDIDAPETKAAAPALVVAKADKQDDPETKVAEKKQRTSSGSDKRVKPKRKRSGGFTYGRLNRLRSPR